MWGMWLPGYTEEPSCQISMVSLLGKTYQCDEWGKHFTEKSTLTNHQKSVHIGKKYPYDECGKQFTEKSTLTKHQQSVHMGKK